jgi:hypothetical protein
MLMINKVLRFAASFFALAVLFCLAACAMDADPPPGDTPPEVTPPALSGAAAAVNVSGESVRLAFTSDRAGTFYALLLDAAEAPPGAAAVKAGAAASGVFAVSGPMTGGQNVREISGLKAGVYTAYITAEDGAGSLVPEPLVLEGINAAPFDIAGSHWYMGVGRLTFGADGKARIHEFNYNYTYNEQTRAGWVSGDTYGRTESYDGKNKGDIINALGNFTVNVDAEGYVSGIAFDNYRETNHRNSNGEEVRLDIVFTPARTAVPSDRLTGTVWSWGGSEGGGLTLEFLPNGKVLQFSPSGYYPHPHIYSSYWFNPEYDYSASYSNDAKPVVELGYIAVADRLCSYSPSNTALGPFIIMHDFTDENGKKRDQCLYFPGPESHYHALEPFNRYGYKAYGHRADFAKRKDD